MTHCIETTRELVDKLLLYWFSYNIATKIFLFSFFLRSHHTVLYGKSPVPFALRTPQKRLAVRKIIVSRLRNFSILKKRPSRMVSVYRHARSGTLVHCDLPNIIRTSRLRRDRIAGVAIQLRDRSRRSRIDGIDSRAIERVGSKGRTGRGRGRRLHAGLGIRTSGVWL